MHVVKQIFSLLSVVAIASCGTMPVPHMDERGESNNTQSTKVVHTSPTNSNSQTSGKSPVTPAKAEGLQDNSYQEKEMPDTSYLASVTQTQDIGDTDTVATMDNRTQSKGANISGENTVYDNPIIISNEPIYSAEAKSTNASIQSEPKQFASILTANGLTKSETNSKQVAQKQELTENTKITKQEPVLEKPKNTVSQSDTNQEVRIQLALAKRYYNSSKYQNAIDLLETPTSSGEPNDKLRDLLLLTYTKYANELVSKANLLEAQTILEKAVSIEPDNIELQNQLKKIKNTRDASRIYQIGLEAVNAGDKTKAFESFQKVLELNPSHSLAKQQVVKIRGSVVESKYKEAMQHYRKQELTYAIRAWNDVLYMDPNHELAKLYRSRALELKIKIDAINKN